VDVDVDVDVHGDGDVDVDASDLASQWRQSLRQPRSWQVELGSELHAELSGELHSSSRSSSLLPLGVEVEVGELGTGGTALIAEMMMTTR